MSDILELTENNFDALISQEDKPVLIDCWSPTCGPCRLLIPIINNLAKVNEGKAIISKLNVAENAALAARLSVVSLPTIFLYKNGKIVSCLQGVQKPAKLQELIDANL